MATLEKILMGEEKCDDAEILEKIDKLRELLLQLAERFAPVAYKVFLHYKKKITFAPTNLQTFYEDLEQECWIGLCRAILRLDPKKVKESPPDAYLSKVIRSHVKETPIGLLHVARIPQSKWMQIPDELKNCLRYQNNHIEHSEESGEEEDIINTVGESFNLEEVEWADFLNALPPIFRVAILTTAGEWDSDLPLPVAKFLSLCALVVYKEG